MHTKGCPGIVTPRGVLAGGGGAAMGGGGMGMGGAGGQAGGGLPPVESGNPNVLALEELPRRTGPAVLMPHSAGGRGEMLELTEEGIRGNSHMLMQDDNSAEIAVRAMDWLEGVASQ